MLGNRGTDGTFSAVHVISIVWLIGDFQSKGNFLSVPRHPAAGERLSPLYPKDSEEKRLLDAMLLAVPRN